MDLLAFERKLDQTIARKRMEIQEAIKKPLTVSGGWESWIPGITGSLRLEKPSEVIKSNHDTQPWPQVGYPGVSWALPGLGDSSSAQGSPFQCFTAHPVDKFSLISTLDLP